MAMLSLLWRPSEKTLTLAHSLNRSGVYCDMEVPDSYVDKAYDNDIALGARVAKLETPAAVRALFPDSVNVAVHDAARGFINYEGGWAWASQGIRRAMDHVSAMGGKIVPGKAVVELTREGGKATGVRCADGSVFAADVVVLASGSWTASAFGGLGLERECLATGYVRGIWRASRVDGDLMRPCAHTGRRWPRSS